MYTNETIVANLAGVDSSEIESDWLSWADDKINI